jgi:hypothetical protein
MLQHLAPIGDGVPLRGTNEMQTKFLLGHRVIIMETKLNYKMKLIKKLNFSFKINKIDLFVKYKINL